MARSPLPAPTNPQAILTEVGKTLFSLRAALRRLDELAIPLGPMTQSNGRAPSLLPGMPHPARHFANPPKSECGVGELRFAETRQFQSQSSYLSFSAATSEHEMRLSTFSPNSKGLTENLPGKLGNAGETAFKTSSLSASKFDFCSFSAGRLLYRYSVSLRQDGWVLTSRHPEQGGSRWNLYQDSRLCCNPLHRR